MRAAAPAPERRGSRPRRPAWPAALVLAVTCASCAAGNRLNLPVPQAGQPALRWPPVPVEGYVTTDGRQHDLPGGYMVEWGDSLLFAPRAETARPALLTARRPATPVVVHRDSVRSVAARLEPAQPDPLAGLIGGALLFGIVWMVLLYGGYSPWAFGS
jgi:hypothetical protein